MNTKINVISHLPLSMSDIARLIAEATEELGEQAQGLTRLELLHMLRRLIRAGAEAVRAEEYSVSFSEAAWASVEARSGLRPTTLRDLRHFVRRMLRVGGVPERSLRAMGTQECRNLLENAFGNSSHSFNKGRAILHSIFAYGLRREWCRDNPVSRIESRRIQEKEIVPLSLQEVRRLEQTVQLPEHQDMRFSLHLLLYNGVRPQEVARLSEHHILVEQKRVIIPPCGSKTGGGRVVPLRKRKQLRGVPLCIPRNWQQRWRLLRRAAGFLFWQPDVCRHTFASYHAAYFRNLGELQLEMGHRSIDLLRSRYLNLPRVAHARKYWELE
ncbi:MAG: hypothetical protein IJ498_08275 [Akkermansia sp.]|nr:hypothetical protein [Akkermansia sp.]